MKQYVVVVKHIFADETIHGPFDSYEDAVGWSLQLGSDPHEIVECINPE